MLLGTDSSMVLLAGQLVFRVLPLGVEGLETGIAVCHDGVPTRDFRLVVGGRFARPRLHEVPQRVGGSPKWISVEAVKFAFPFRLG